MIASCGRFVSILVMLIVMLATAAVAQRGPYRSDRGDVAGEFDYYALVLSWSPTYCASLPSNGEDPQCHRRDGRRYAFVLHGLWPQNERGYPEFCRTRDRPFVPRGVIDGMLDIMPSPKLVIHEYRKHGTCSGLDPSAYYDTSRRLFQRIKIPPRFVNPSAPILIDRADLVAEFVAANPALKPDMLAVSCGGNRLREVRVCFSRDGQFRSCGANENQRRLCATERLYAPPVRGG